MVLRAARIMPCLLAGLLAACGHSPSSGAGTATSTDGSSAAAATWAAVRHVRGVVDLSAPRRDGTVLVAAAGHLEVLSPHGALRPYAPAYRAPAGLEPYVALSPGQEVPGAGCRFPAGALYALRLAGGNGVTVVEASGAVRRFAALPRRGLENGIAFDLTGRFRHRLLVTTVSGGRTTLDAIDCRGRVSVLTRTGPRVEGGLAVAPSTFGRFAGHLIGSDELSGNLYAFDPDGRATLLGSSGLPHGPDVGIESEGFVPSRYERALVADRRTPGNRHPGDDAILALSRAALAGAGVKAGDLLVVGEGGAGTAAVTCTTACHVRRVGAGPAIAHVEGHVVFT